MTLVWEAAGASHVGRIRAGNEDAFRIDVGRGIFLVADGMGGHAAGEVASALAADVVAASAARAVDEGPESGAVEDALRSAVLQAHARIVEHCLRTPAARGMGTTLTVVVVDPSGRAHAAHIGDSRLYRFDGIALHQATRDHTWVQREIDAGRIPPQDARSHPLSHILTNVLTDDIAPEVDTLSLPISGGDELLLVTDGLYNMLGDDAITDTLRSGGSLSERVERLVDEANEAGGADNVTLVLVRLIDGRTAAPPARG